MNEVYFTPESKGKGINSSADYISDFIGTIRDVINLAYDDAKILISHLIQIVDVNIMKVEFQYKDHNYKFELEKTSRWVYKKEWKGIIILDDKQYIFPLSPVDKNEINNIIFTPTERVERLLNGYDYYFEYIDNGKQWQAAKDNNQRIISAVKSFNIPKEQLFSIIDKVFSEKEANGMKKIFS